MRSRFAFPVPYGRRRADAAAPAAASPGEPAPAPPEVPWPQRSTATLLPPPWAAAEPVPPSLGAVALAGPSGAGGPARR